MINPKARPCEEAAILSTRAAGNCAASAKPWVLVATILASSIAYIDESVVNVALPAMETDLATSVSGDSVAGQCLHALSFGASADRGRRRRSFRPPPHIRRRHRGLRRRFAVRADCRPARRQLILARAIQGIGAALLIPCSLAIIGATFEESERGKAIGTWAGIFRDRRRRRPAARRQIVDHFSWRWIFLINPLLALPTIWIALPHVPESRDAEAKGGLDWRGPLLAFAALGSLAYGLISAPVAGWSDPTVSLSLAAGLLLMPVFIWEEAHSRARCCRSDCFARAPSAPSIC